jgi:hypothetical protein
VPVQLPEPIPAPIARLPKDDRGYPVPWFIQWIKDSKEAAPGEGQPDFRYMDPKKWEEGLMRGRCWVCGGTLGTHRIFVIGPMCAINRVTQEPPCHRACAEYACKACPFLARPRMRRNIKGLPDDVYDNVGGMMIERNPGAMALWETRKYRPFKAGNGWLIRLGEPDRVDWWAEGRQATRAEIVESIRTGFPILQAACQQDADPEDSLKELEKQRERAMALLPAA